MVNEKRLDIKKIMLLVRYHGRLAARNFAVYVPVFFLILSSLLSAYAVTHTLHVKGEKLQISGVVSGEQVLPNGSVEIRPIENAIVDIGGYRTRSGRDGGYELEFWSESVSDIPVVVRDSNQEIIERISFLPNEKTREHNIVFK